GIHAEVRHDIAFAPAPVDATETRRLVDSLRMRSLLDGVRGAPPADVDAFAELAHRLSLLGAAAQGRIAEIEINPVFVHPAEIGVSAVDALLRLRPPGARLLAHIRRPALHSGGDEHHTHSP